MFDLRDHAVGPVAAHEVTQVVYPVFFDEAPEVAPPVYRKWPRVGAVALLAQRLPVLDVAGAGEHLAEHAGGR